MNVTHFLTGIGGTPAGTRLPRQGAEPGGNGAAVRRARFSGIKATPYHGTVPILPRLSWRAPQAFAFAQIEAELGFEGFDLMAHCALGDIAVGSGEAFVSCSRLEGAQGVEGWPVAGHAIHEKISGIHEKPCFAQECLVAPMRTKPVRLCGPRSS